jgi:glutamate formiminotransferase
LTHGLFECVINISEGRNDYLLTQLEHTAGRSFRHRHSDPFHNRSVFTLINNDTELQFDAQWLIRNAIDVLDFEDHDGVHPRFGVVDVVPYVALDERDRERARELRDETAAWMGNLDIPVFLYGLVGSEERTLPDVRRRAFRDLAPDFGPGSPELGTGAAAVGERPLLVAWNMYVEGLSESQVRDMARLIRGDGIRTLALHVGPRWQVSCNLIEPLRIGPDVAYDRLLSVLPEGGHISECELVGLAPTEVLVHIDESRWPQLGLREDLTIEFVLDELALD